MPPEVRDRERFFQIDETTAICYQSNAGGFMVKNGREVIVETATSVADSLLRSLLLGVGFSCLLHQRGFLVLHSSAVAFRGGDGFGHAIGFVGQSHSGKSTMAAALHKRGHRALSDDLLALSLDFQWEGKQANSSGPLVYPGHLHIKLRPPSVEAFGETESLPRWHANLESYLFQFPEQAVTQPLPLRCLYTLEEGPKIQIELMEPHQSLMKLVNNSLCVRSLPTMNTDRNFLQCAQLARQVPLYRLQRPLDFNQLSEVLDAVEEHQAQLK
ncbi:MAG TPA: hypothetical protein VF627_04510 [Abditibacterium sp.]